MATYALGGWQFGVNLEDLLNEAMQVHADIDQYRKAGDDDTNRQERVAAIVNHAIEEFIEQNEAIGWTTITQAVTSASNTYTVPTTLHGLFVPLLYWADSGSEPEYDLRQLTYLSRADVEQLPPSDYNGDTTAEYPDRWSFNDSGASFVLYPYPSASKTLTIKYRQRPTEVSTANIASPSGVTVSELPKRAQRCVAMRIAADLIKLSDPARAQSLMGEWQTELETCKRLFSHTPAATQSGKAKGLFNYHSAFRFEPGSNSRRY
jgi:hypothetical protein